MSETFFTSDRGGAHNLYAQRIDRREPARQLTNSPNHQDPVVCTPDGCYPAYWDNSRETGSDLRLLPLAGGDSQPMVATVANESHAGFSPDGGYLAYASDESGISQVYLEPFGGPGERMQISVDGSAEPIWHPDGSRLYFRSTNGARLMVVTMESRSPLRFSAPRVIARGSYRPNFYGVPNFALHFRDDRFLMIEERTDSQQRGIEVILNWRLDRPD